ncbi:MAG: cell division protein FtsW [Proteobacteria bacterium]|nr:cell division protein FtsW [Pseudomonadota bacterium]NCA28570.1 cell division protein FtsW [Pseudomonadota bacterium]
MENWSLNNHSMFDRNKISVLKKWWLDIDKINFSIILILIIFGLMMTATSSPAIAKRIDVDKFFFLRKQLIFAFIALMILFSISFFNHEQIKVMAILGMIFSLILLILVLFIGSKAKGATRWISVAGLTLQPSEFAKTFFIIFNALCLQKFYYTKIHFKYGISLLSLLILMTLLFLQPDFGMMVSYLAIWATQIFLYGLPLILIGGLAFLAVFGGVGAYLSLPHVEDRINRFLDSGKKNYQAEQALDAFVNGSFFGKGPGNGMVKKQIPDVHTDFIFSAIGEEFGIISCAIILLIFGYLVIRIVKRAIEEKDLFVYLSMCGLMMQFVMQVIVNTGVSLSVFPTKGMTLPFISYGGSSLMATAICFGLILAFTKRKYHREVDYGNTKFL